MFLSLLSYRLLERESGGKYPCEKILKTLRGVNFASAEEQGYMPLYWRDEITDKLHETCGFRGPHFGFFQWKCTVPEPLPYPFLFLPSVLLCRKQKGRSFYLPTLPPGNHPGKKGSCPEYGFRRFPAVLPEGSRGSLHSCLLYTSDAADD